MKNLHQIKDPEPPSFWDLIRDQPIYQPAPYQRRIVDHVLSREEFLRAIDRIRAGRH